MTDTKKPLISGGKNGNDPIIEQLICEALEALLPDTVWPVLLPQNPDYPAITWHRKTVQRTSGTDSRNALALQNADGELSEFQVVIYDRSYMAAALMLRQVRQALEPIGMVLESAGDGYEYEQNVYAIISEWSVWGDLIADETRPLGQWDSLNPWAQSVEKALKERFTNDIALIRFQSPQTRTLNTPALIVDIESIRQGKDPGDGRCQLQLSAAIHCLVPVNRQDAPVAVRSLASDVMSLLLYNRFTDDGGIPEDIEAQPADDWPGRYGFHRWTVTWTQTVVLGASLWPDECNPPADPFYSWKPAIGPDHEPDYKPLLDLPPCEDSAA